MFTSIDKNLLIAAMESALDFAHQRANIASFSELETRVSALRQAFSISPENVLDSEIYSLIDTIQAAQIPDFKTIQSIPRADVAYSYIWDRILNKPATFPPAEHTHEALSATWENIAGKPSTYPPTSHAHTFASITSKP